MNNLMSLGTEGNASQTITSREIAELTGKSHGHVGRDIVKLNETYTKLGLSTCGEGVYTLESTFSQKHRMFYLTKIQTVDLMTGYSLELRIKINRRWEELEKANQTPQLPTTYLQALKELVFVTEEKEEALALITIQKEQIKLDAPKVEFADSVADSTDAIDMGTFAKLVFSEVKLGRTKMFAKLRDMGILGCKNVPYQQYINNGTFKVVESTVTTPYGSKLTTKTLVTGTGQMYLLKRLNK